MGSVRPGVPTLTVALRGMAMVTVEVRTLAGPKHSGQFGGAAPDALIALLHALAVAARRARRRRRRRACGARSGRARPTATTSSASSPRSSPGVPLLRHRRARRADLVRARRSPSPGIDVLPVDGAVNAVVPYARAKLSLRVHPEQDPAEAQAALIEHLEALRPFGVALTVHAGETGNGLRREDRRPGLRRRARRRSRAPGAARRSTFASGGSIPLVSALQEAAPDAEMLLLGTTDGFANIHAPNERVLLDEFEKAVARRGRRSSAATPRSPPARERRVSDAARVSAEPPSTASSSGCSTGSSALGNKMPDPAILFLWLCVGVIVLSQVLYWFDVKATYEVVKPPPVPAEETYYGGSVEPTDVGPTEPEPAERLPASRTETAEGQGPADRRGRALPVHVVRRQLPQLRRGRDHPRGDDRRRPGRGGRADRRADTQARRRSRRRAR